MSRKRPFEGSLSSLSIAANTSGLYALVLAELAEEEKDGKDPRQLVVPSQALANMVRFQDNLGYVKYIRLDRRLFADLLARFAPLHERRLIRQSTSLAPRARLARRVLTSAETLFALLRFLAASSSIGDLCVIAGVSSSTMERAIRSGLVTLLVVLRHWQSSAIRSPTNAEAVLLSARISRRIPYLENFIGFADGVLV